MRKASRKSFAFSTAIAAVAGYIDGLGFIGTGGLFVSFMSGNSTQAGVELVNANFTMALLGLALVASFVAGVTIGTLLTAPGRPRETMLWFAALCVLGALCIELITPGIPWRFTLVAAAMGAVNTLYVVDGRARIAMTYATGTLVSLGIGVADVFRGKATTTAWLRPLTLWAALTLGAIAGGVLAVASPILAPVIGSAALVAVAVFLSLWDHRRLPSR